MICHMDGLVILTKFTIVVVIKVWKRRRRVNKRMTCYNKYKKNHGGCAGHRVDMGTDGYDYECDYEFSGDVDCGDCIFGGWGGKRDPRKDYSKENEFDIAWYNLKEAMMGTKLVRALIWVLNKINNGLGRVIEWQKQSRLSKQDRMRNQR